MHVVFRCFGVIALGYALVGCVEPTTDASPPPGDSDKGGPIDAIVTLSPHHDTTYRFACNEYVSCDVALQLRLSQDSLETEATYDAIAQYFATYHDQVAASFILGYADVLESLPGGDRKLLGDIPLYMEIRKKLEPSEPPYWFETITQAHQETGLDPMASIKIVIRPSDWLRQTGWTHAKLRVTGGFD